MNAPIRIEPVKLNDSQTKPRKIGAHITTPTIAPLAYVEDQLAPSYLLPSPSLITRTRNGE
eukprot:gene9542-6699_t